MQIVVKKDDFNKGLIKSIQIASIMTISDLNGIVKIVASHKDDNIVFEFNVPVSEHTLSLDIKSIFAYDFDNELKLFDEMCKTNYCAVYKNMLDNDAYVNYDIKSHIVSLIEEKDEMSLYGVNAFRMSLGFEKMLLKEDFQNDVKTFLEK